MKNKKTDDLVTKKYLKEYLDKKISESEKRLNARMDRMMKYLKFHLEPLRSKRII